MAAVDGIPVLPLHPAEVVEVDTDLAVAEEAVAEVTANNWEEEDTELRLPFRPSSSSRPSVRRSRPATAPSHRRRLVSRRLSSPRRPSLPADTAVNPLYCHAFHPIFLSRKKTKFIRNNWRKNEVFNVGSNHQRALHLHFSHSFISFCV